MNPILANRLLRWTLGGMSRVRGLWLRSLGTDMGCGCRFSRGVEVPRNPHLIRLGDYVALDRGVILLTTSSKTENQKLIEIEDNTYINRYTFIDASKRVTIGCHCMIGPFCYITDHDHGYKLGREIYEQDLTEAETRISDGVWLGAGVIVLKGVTIGSGAVVGAGSVVTKTIESGKIAIGSPARVVGSRGK